MFFFIYLFYFAPLPFSSPRGVRYRAFFVGAPRGVHVRPRHLIWQYRRWRCWCSIRLFFVGAVFQVTFSIVATAEARHARQPVCGCVKKQATPLGVLPRFL